MQGDLKPVLLWQQGKIYAISPVKLHAKIPSDMLYDSEALELVQSII